MIFHILHGRDVTTEYTVNSNSVANKVIVIHPHAKCQYDKIEYIMNYACITRRENTMLYLHVV